MEKEFHVLITCEIENEGVFTSDIKVKADGKITDMNVSALKKISNEFFQGDLKITQVKSLNLKLVSDEKF